MTTHLKPDQIDAAIAGLEIEPEVQTHLDTCVRCRTEVAEFGRLIESRRGELAADEPDWALQIQEIMGRLPIETAASRRARPGWMRPVLAVAATLIVAVGIGVVRWERPAQPPAAEVAVDEILAEMDELLADDSIPGFEIIDPETDDLESYFDNGAS